MTAADGPVAPGAPQLPRAVRTFATFPSLLRAHGFPVAPDQTVTFIEAVGLLGPRRMADIYHAAVATLGPPRERRPEFDALYRLHFLGHTLGSDPADGADDEEVLIQEAAAGPEVQPPDAGEREAGRAAARAELLGVRSFAATEEADALRRLRRDAPGRLPRRTSRRRAPARRGSALNMRLALREAVRRDGEVLTLPKLRRATRPRRVLMLIDVSGSMKRLTAASLRLAHALARTTPAFEAFTVGTRLTRVTAALRLRHPDRALAAVAELVADWDGGTRLGDALAAFLAIPRFASLGRGAFAIVLSDGLERGEPRALVDAVARLHRLSWRLHWLTPLAGDAGFEPRTAALRAMLPYLDHLGDGSSLGRIAAHLLSPGLGKAA